MVVSALDVATLDDLLERTSRTFALTIPLLGEPLRKQVTLAYLLFRIADTLEDADLLGRDARLRCLSRFGALLAGDTPHPSALAHFVAECATAPPSSNPEYAELLHETAQVFDALHDVGEEPSALIRRHLSRTTELMAAFVARADAKGTLALRDIPDLRAYCYAVAGIVGEMLTALVVHAEPSLEPVRERLEADAIAFGEALQLTNILRDAGTDAQEGRTFVPPQIDRAEVFALAEEDLARARRYTSVLAKNWASRGTIAFHALPVRLAAATLTAVKKNGPGAKIPRELVAAEMAAMNLDLDRGGDGLA